VFEAKVEELETARDADGAGSEAAGQRCDARTTLILDLSSKVAEQEREIIQLRDELRMRDLLPDADATPTRLSEVSESLPRFADTERGHQSSARRNGSTDCAGSRGGPTGDGSNRLHWNENARVAPTDVENNFSRSRTSKRPVESYSKNSAKPERNAAAFRAHWASSCFDVDALTDDDVAGTEPQTTVYDDDDKAASASTQS